LWDAATAKHVATIQAHKDEVSSLAFSPDSRLLTSASWDRTIKVWDVATRVNVARATADKYHVYSVAISKDGKLLASGGLDAQIKVWDFASLHSPADN
jgi:WD40 repeat protein